MQSSDTHRVSEQAYARARSAGARCIPPGALAGYFQAQQAWRRTQAAPKQSEGSNNQQSQSSLRSSAASANSTSSCSTSDRHFERHGNCGLPALGCRSVARLFQQRHELLNRHRQQRQAAKRRRSSTGAFATQTGLLSLPEDVLVSAMLPPLLFWLMVFVSEVGQ